MEKLHTILTAEEIDEKPWRYIGYSGFTDWMSSDPDFFVVRRFDNLFTRGLLYQQGKISELGSKLEDLDQQYQKVQDNGSEVNNGTVWDDLQDRKQLVHEISQSLSEYYTSILQYSQLHSRGTARKRVAQNAQTWLYKNHPGAICEEEADFINHEEDLIPVIEKRQSQLRQITEDWLAKIPPLSFSMARQRLGKVDSETVHYTSDRSIEISTSIATLLTGSFMLVAPLWILQAIHDFQKRLAVITIFILASLTVLTFSTPGKSFEILAATAGYSAVLVVFLQFGVSQT